MKNCKECKMNCGSCKYALVVENFDEQPYLERPTVYDSDDEEMDRQARLGIYTWHTPTKTLCYLPDDMECNYFTMIDKTLLSETHPQIFIEQMVDLYENDTIEFLEKGIAERRANGGAMPYDTNPYWLTIYEKIYERKTGKTYEANRE